ncbi:hypothetical protein K402DRAFT_230929 [Aulographum hederae CBS 113979]|uniref:Thiolase-like protein type 1 additional C-terminal domain-containing protein n=1 Tax=Aulographum hederae CBS 113979 TaxID=1176131 RepID=A0A6G1HBV1_9PEZI|nr:hypothetical protein K402DRAFT_230929 [Aulographum hederae CBS 113979]
MASQTPVIIGVADIKNKTSKPIEPKDLILSSIHAALDNASPSPKNPKIKQSLLTHTTSLSVVRPWTWPYPDLPTLLATSLSILPHCTHLELSAHGGNQPAKLLDEAARRISLSPSPSTVAIVTGGESLASLAACAKTGQLPPPGWTKPAQDVESVFSPTTRDLGEDVGAKHGIGAPIHVYPLYEVGLRAKTGQTPQENHRKSAELYADFAAVAAENEVAWSYGEPAMTARDIAAVGGRNRMICSPYPLLMNAFNTVNLAAAVVVTSEAFALELGIAREKMIYPLGGAGTKDAEHFWERPDFYSSPSIERSITGALEVSGVRKEEVDVYDFYSCFPVVPKLAARCLDLSVVGPGKKKELTLLGGLTSFGGAGNNYSLHAVTEMVRRLRRSSSGSTGRGKGGGERKEENGLILANGGVLSYQHVIILSNIRPAAGRSYPAKNPLKEIVDDIPVPQLELNPEGECVIETYTISYSRTNAPETAFIIGRLVSSGKRFLANHADTATLKELARMDREMVGRKGWVWPADIGGKGGDRGGRNIFGFEKSASL